MRVVHINFGLEMGGLETMLIDIINEQCSQVDLYLIIINEQVDTALLASIDPRVTILLVGRPKGSRNPIYIVKLNRLLNRLRPNVVHCHNHQIIRMLWQKIGQRYLTVHDVQVPISHFRRYDKLFAISDVVKYDIQKRAGLNVKRIYNGIRTRNIIQKHTYTENKPFRIVQVSRLHHDKKGQHILLNALNKLVYNYGLTNIHVDFIGEGDSRVYLEQLSRTLQLTNYVSFVGIKTRAEIYQCLHHYNLLVQPSLYEGFGLTVAEGMAAGVPVVVSNIDGPMELIANDRYGLSFRAGDANHLADQIRHVVFNYMSTDLQMLITNAQQHACLSFDVRKTADSYLASY